ncbi:TPA: RIP metalloprotease RseP, partial [Candidatus Beckwithbacteria bacterium]|nr:RIP metalloprotease RseP [Candidatus Beckwithbacteria bacterium]
MTLIIFIIVLAILVLAHEWGHFMAAKKSGLTVEEFGFGFPPKIFSFKKGETTYSVNLLPL